MLSSRSADIVAWKDPNSRVEGSKRGFTREYERCLEAVAAEEAGDYSELSLPICRTVVAIGLIILLFQLVIVIVLAITDKCRPSIGFPSVWLSTSSSRPWSPWWPPQQRSKKASPQPMANHALHSPKFWDVACTPFITIQDGPGFLSYLV